MELVQEVSEMPAPDSAQQREGDWHTQSFTLTAASHTEHCWLLKRKVSWLDLTFCWDKTHYCFLGHDKLAFINPQGELFW